MQRAALQPRHRRRVALRQLAEGTTGTAVPGAGAGAVVRVGPGLGVLVAVCCPAGPTLLGDVATLLEPDRHRHRHRGGHGQPGRHPAAAPDAVRPAAHRGQVDRLVVAHVAGAVVERIAQQVLLVVAHRSSSRSFASTGLSWTRDRRAARARLAWDFTVPTEMPSTCAVSASLRSS